MTASSSSRGTVTGISPSGSAIPGSTITIYVSDGSVREAPPAPANPARPDIELPELPPIQIPAIPGLTVPR